MTSRIRTIAALLIAGAALAATPALAADSVAGNRGPAEKPANRDAPISLPGAIVAKALPKVDAATLSRDIFGTDPAAGLASLGTVSLSRDGSVSETPASDALRGIFEEMVKGHHN
jgi:hypothetical protein